MRKSKIKVLLLSMLLITLSIPGTVFAEEEPITIEAPEDDIDLDVIEPVTENDGVGIELPIENTMTRGLAKPTVTWNIGSQGDRTFSGTANSSTLYTNYLLTGASKYRVFLTNTHSSKTLTVKVFNSGAIFSSASTTIKAGKTGYIDYTPPSSSTKFYVSFSAPSNFTGYVRKN